MADSLKASAAGLAQIDLERRKKGWTKQAPAWINAANELLPSQDAISISTLKRFWAKGSIRQKGFAAICKAVGVDDWQAIADLPTSPQPAEPEAIEPPNIDNFVQEVRDRCCVYVFDLYSKIQLISGKQVNASRFHIDVNVLEECAKESRATIPGMLKDRNLYKDFDRFGLGQRKERMFGLEVVQQEPKLILFGKPGSGKSTFLKQIAIACCKAELLVDYIPIFFELRSIEDATRFNLLDVVHQQLGSSDQEETKQLLSGGKVLLLLDGLDEISGQVQCKVQEHIYQFSKHPQYYKNRFVLTCRTQTTEYIDFTFKSIEIDDFKPEQIERFAYEWFQASTSEPRQAEGLARQFVTKLRSPENKQTAELAVTPILLSLTCWVFEKLEDFPSKRSKLYEEAIDLLLKELDKRKGVQRSSGSKIYQNLSLLEKKNLLSNVAARKFEEEQYVLFEQNEIQKYIADYLSISIEDAEEVLKAIESHHGLLVARARGIYSFSHLTFHEYFAAQEFSNNSDSQIVKQLVQILVNHLTEKRYREVFLLTAEMLPSADYLLQAMKGEVDRLQLKNEKLQKILAQVKEKSNTVKVSYKLAATRAFYFRETWEQRGFIRVLDEKGNPYIDDGEGDNNYFSDVSTLALAMDQTLMRNYNDDYRCYHIPSSGLDFALDIALLNVLNYKIPIDATFSTYLKKMLRLVEYLRLKDENESFFEQILILCQSKTNCEYDRQILDQELIDALRPLVIEHRQVGHDWQFTDEQEELMQQYYDANKLLVDCLNSDCEVSENVRQEIEETLLLPIAEIEAWKKNKGKS